MLSGVLICQESTVRNEMLGFGFTQAPQWKGGLSWSQTGMQWHADAHAEKPQLFFTLSLAGNKAEQEGVSQQQDQCRERR